MPDLDGIASRQRAHGFRRRALRSLSVSLARHPGLVAYAWAIARARRQRLARIALIFEFVRRLAAAPPRKPPAAGLREGDLRAALLWALLRAAGERATLEFTREMTLVRVSVALADVRRLPPWARLLRSAAGGLEVALAPNGEWTSAGYLPPDVRAALRRRRAPLAIAS